MDVVYDSFLNIAINEDLSRPKVSYALQNDVLKIELSNNSFLIQSNIDKLETPEDLVVEL